MTFVEQLSHEERKEGQEEGIARGRIGSLVIGLLEGFEEGQKEGIALEKVNMAVNCLKKGLQMDLITELTGLPTEQINALAKEHKIH